MLKNPKQAKKEYDLIVFIGRFQPFHVAHKEILEKAFLFSEKVLVLIGSSTAPLSPKNPFSYVTRETLIRDSFSSEKQISSNLFIEGVEDYPYDEFQWIQRVEEIAASKTKYFTNPKIGIIGMDKDESSYYLKFFPQWDLIPIERLESNGHTIDATQIRNLMFSNHISFISGVLPSNVYKYLADSWTQTDEFKHLQEEYDYLENYKKAWINSPFTPVFVTVDAVVVQSGHILLIQRKVHPGKGLYALPGGFINQRETLVDAVIRELREETRLKIPEKVLRGSIVKSKVFDSPSRSQRGRTITHAFKFQLDDTQELPKVRGGDDAKSAKWFSLHEYSQMQSKLFEDHFGIIYHML